MKNVCKYLTVCDLSLKFRQLLMRKELCLPQWVAIILARWLASWWFVLTIYWCSSSS